MKLFIAEKCANSLRGRSDDASNLSTAPPLHGLSRMEDIRFHYNNFLTAGGLRSLVASTVIPQSLTRLEIVDCPAIHPLKDLETVALLLKRVRIAMIQAPQLLETT